MLSKLIKDFLENNPNQTAISRKAIEKLLKAASNDSIDSSENDDTQDADLIPSKVYTVSEIKKYDVIYTKVGPCRHFVIITKVFDNETVIGITITHGKSLKFKLPFESRMFPANHVGILFQEIPLELAKKSFVCSLIEEKKQIDEIIRFAKNTYKELIFK